MEEAFERMKQLLGRVVADLAASIMSFGKKGIEEEEEIQCKEAEAHLFSFSISFPPSIILTPLSLSAP